MLSRVKFPATCGALSMMIITCSSIASLSQPVPTTRLFSPFLLSIVNSMAEMDFLRDISGRWPLGDHIAFFPFLKWHISRVDEGRDADLISTEKRRIVDFIVRNANSGRIIQERETEAKRPLTALNGWLHFMSLMISTFWTTLALFSNEGKQKVNKARRRSFGWSLAP
jgi:hypothetical protein